MKRLSFSDWCDKYEENYYDEYEEYVEECKAFENTPMELWEFLEDKYEESISEYNDMAYDFWKEERHFND